MNVFLIILALLVVSGSIGAFIGHCMSIASGEESVWFEMTYICPKCGSSWHEEWDSIIESDCPHESCGQRHVVASSHQQLKGAINV